MSTPPCVWSQDIAAFIPGEFRAFWGYEIYDSRFSSTDIKNVFTQSNVWDAGLTMYYKFDPITRELVSIDGMGDQTHTFSGGVTLAYTATGYYSMCDRMSITIKYKFVRLSNGVVYDDNMLTYLRN